MNIDGEVWRVETKSRLEFSIKWGDSDTPKSLLCIYRFDVFFYYSMNPRQNSLEPSSPSFKDQIKPSNFNKSTITPYK